MKCFILLLIFIIFLLQGSSCLAAEDGFDPWSFKQISSGIEELRIKKVEKHISAPAFFLLSAVRIFKDYVSPVDGDRCRMYPTCSNYSLEAINNHGFIMGYLMTVDRLIHENNEMETAPLIKIGQQIRFYDPVANNDFWWRLPPAY